MTALVVATAGCLVLSGLLAALCVIPAALVGCRLSVRQVSLMVGWGGVAVAVAAVAVNL